MEGISRRGKTAEDNGVSSKPVPEAEEVRVSNSRPLLGARAQLPLLEKLVYAAVYVTCFVIAVYKIYKFPLEHRNELYKQDFKAGWKFTGRKKDISDFEWQFWHGFFKTMLIGSVLHSLGFRVVATLYPKYKLVYCAAFQSVLLIYMLGWKAMLVYLGHNILYFVASQLKSVVVCWLLAVAMLYSFVSSKTLTQWQFYTSTRNASEGDFLMFSSLMCQLRGMSFCLDACRTSTEKKDDKPSVTYGFMDLLGYNLYLPLFCNGPVILYNEFFAQVSKPAKDLSKDAVCSFLWDGGRTLFWFFIMDLGFHYLYIHSMARDTYIVQTFSPWLSIGLLYNLTLLFSIKYVIFYRFAGMFARLDGVNPPDIPRCVFQIYTFTEMWQTFDKGLHTWLMKYIYIPLGGSRKGLLRQLLSSTLTFSYVYYWHGAYDYLLYWSLIQWFGVFVEAMAGKVLKTKAMQNLETNILSPAGTRRLHAICGAFTVTAAILSNCVFLINYPSVVACLKVIFIKGGVWRGLSFIAVAYCLVQTIMEVKILIGQDMSKKKKL